MFHILAMGCNAIYLPFTYTAYATEQGVWCFGTNLFTAISALSFLCVRVFV